MQSDTSKKIRTIAELCKKSTFIIKARKEISKILLDVAETLDTLDEVNENLREKNNYLRDLNDTLRKNDQFLQGLTNCNSCTREPCIGRPGPDQPLRYNCMVYTAEKGDET